MKNFVIKHKASLLLFLAVICVQVFIFSFSIRDGETSSAQSSAVVELVGPAVEEILPVVKVEPTPDNVVIFVRKSGHFLEFALLGIVSFLAMGSVWKKGLFAMPAALGLAFLTACADEFIQSFSPGRASRFTDVLIDSAGALTGILLAWLLAICIRAIVRSRRARKMAKEQLT